MTSKTQQVKQKRWQRSKASSSNSDVWKIKLTNSAGVRLVSQNFCQRLREYCTGRGISYFMTPSDASLEQLLLKRLREAEVWG